MATKEPTAGEDSTDTSSTEQIMTRQQIEDALSQILNDIEKKRTHDVDIVSGVKKEIMAQAEKSCQLLDEYMSRMHETKGKELDEQVQALLQVLNRVKQTEEELEDSKTSLSRLCSDFQARDL